MVTRVSPDGPADKAGMRNGDIVVGVGGDPVKTHEELYRKVWGLGAAGIEVPLKVLQGVDMRELKLRSIDRFQYFKGEAGLLVAKRRSRLRGDAGKLLRRRRVLPAAAPAAMAGFEIVGGGEVETLAFLLGRAPQYTDSAMPRIRPTPHRLCIAVTRVSIMFAVSSFPVVPGSYPSQSRKQARPRRGRVSIVTS